MANASRKSDASDFSKDFSNGLIFWAIDPITTDAALAKKAADLIAVVAHQMNGPVEVQPVTVVNPEELTWPTEMHGDWETHFRETVSRRIEDLLNDPDQGISRHGIATRPPLLLTETLDMMSGVARSVETFLHAAREQDARLIVAATQSRNDLERLILGSFCETLLVTSEIPVLTVNPKTDVPENINSVYYSTDLSDESKDQLPAAVGLARALGATLILVHKVTVPAPPIIEPGFVAAADTETIQALFADYREEQKRMLRTWCEEVSRTGVTCRAAEIDEGGGLTEALLEVAHNAHDALFVTALQSQKGLARLIGHISRNLARESELPTLTLPSSP